ncbi:AlpA family transcriptional regulator [uncultured Roseobacter sp.]|uniref:helix-turn-helix transcriptional regulator n=1 Tax=uncultured Roseobacter sp. TaxID=114847 RepID=UPI002639B1FC|nr:AlpA family phage regulatory protein [uncultured Roseobacter sp.]
MAEHNTTVETHPQPLVLLSRSDLKNLGITLSNSSLLRAEARGAFPRRLRPSPATVCWDRAEVAEWLERRKAERADWHYADAR